MKKISSIILAGLAVFAIASCSKETEVVDTTETPEIGEKEYVLTFTAQHPQLANETRTEWNGSTVVWSNQDKIRVAYTIDGNWMGQAEATGNKSAKFYSSDPVVIDRSDASVGTFTVPVGNSSFSNPNSSGTYAFYALYPNTAVSSATINNVEALTVSVPSAQTPSDVSFQKNADLLLGKTAELAVDGIPTDPIAIAWTRLVAHADLTFSNIAFEGMETIQSITLITNADAKWTGDISINLPAGTVSTGSSNELVINGTNLTPTGSCVEAWACVLPVTFTSLDVEIKTSKATYTKSISGFSKTFKQNARNRLTISMNGAERTADTPDEYSLFNGDIVEGDYIVYYSGYALKAAVSNNRMENQSVSVTNDVISTNDASIIWHIAPSATSATSGYYTFYNADTEKYLAATESNNQAQLLENGTDDKALFSLVEDSEYDFINKSNSRYLRQNGNNGWAMYAAGTGGAISLYGKDSRTALEAPTNVTAALNSSDNTVIDVSFGTVTGAASYVITATPGSGDPIVKTGVTASPAAISIADGLAYNTSYTISVYAVPSNTQDYKNSSEAVASEAVTTGSAPEGYQLLTSLDDVTSGLYIIAAKVGDSYIGMPNTFGTSPFAGSNVTVSGGFVTSADASDFSVRITKNGSDYSIVGSNSTLGYGSGTSFSPNANGDAALWTITSGTSGSFRIANKGTNTRAIIYRDGGTKKFGAYSTNNVNGSEYFDVELFKYNGIVKEVPTLSFTNPTTSLNVGESVENIATISPSGLAISYSADPTSVATVSGDGVVTAISAGTVTITASFAGNDQYDAVTASYTLTVNALANIAGVIAGKAGTYEVPNVLVYAVKGNALILGDETGKMYAYKSGHGLSVGDSRTVSGVTEVTNSGVYEFNNPTFTGTGTAAVNHGTAAELDSQASSLQSEFTAANNFHSAIYIHAKGTQSGRTITTTDGNVLYLSATEDGTDGKGVDVYGYVYAYSSSHSNFNLLVTAIEEDPNISTLDVSPESLNWQASEFGSDYSKTSEISLNDNATGYSISGSNNAWTISDNGNGLITVYPNAANTSTTDDKTLTITITHDDASDVTKTIICTQAKVSSGNTPVTVSSSSLGSASTTATSMDGEISYVNSASNTYSNPMRIYANNTFTISSKNASITQVVFTCNNADYATVLNGATFTVDNGASVSKSVSGLVVTVTISGSSKNLSVKAIAQYRLDGLSVTYQN